MEKIPKEILQKIGRFNKEYLQRLSLNECYKKFIEFQEIKKRYRYKDINPQEEHFLKILKKDILEKLKIQPSEENKLQWKGYEFFEIEGVKNINNTNPNFFPTIKKYKIRFEACSFVGDKISQGDNQSYFFYQLKCPEPEIDFSLIFNNCVFFNFVNLPSIVFHEQIFFNHCIFFNGVNFHGSTFKEDIFLQDAVYRKKSDFSHCIFEKRAFFGGTRTKFKCEANFLDATFKEESNFSKVIFESEANFFLTHSIEQDTKGFRKHANFSGACFKKNANFNCNIFFAGDFRKTTFKDNTNFSESSFLKCADFSDTKFLGKITFKDAKIGKSPKEQDTKTKADFSRCIFSQEVDFSSTHFYNETYFHRAIFHQGIQFYRSYFEGIANFYFVDFKGIPNFSMCVFNQPKFVNFVGVVLPQNTIDKLEEYINQKAGKEAKEKDNTEKGRTKTYLCIQHSLNIRDSFRVIKETLTTQSNLLDTQQWHKLELYAKELECKYRDDTSTLSQEIKELKKQKEFEDFDNTNSARTLEINQKELGKNRIEFWQLWFYRKTSDHHTNLAKIINNVIMLIALFGIFSFGLLDFSTNPNSTIDSKIPINFVFGKISLLPKSLVWIILGSCLSVWGLSKLSKCQLLKVLKIKSKKFSKYGLKEWLSWACFGTIALCFLAPFLLSGITFLTIAIPSIQEVFFVFALCLGFVAGYLGLIWLTDRGITLIAYLICIGILILKPTLLLPFVGQLFDEGLKANFPAMQSLSVVYCILMVLMLFSLQKTARKNSIVPS